jgi:hypothetical protein
MGMYTERKHKSPNVLIFKGLLDICGINRISPMSEKHPYTVDDVDKTIRQIKEKLWFERSSALDGYVLELFGNPRSSGDITYSEAVSHTLEEPEMCREICWMCDADPCRCLDARQRSIIPSSLWGDRSEYIKFDHVMIKLDGLLSDEYLTYDGCYVSPTVHFRPMWNAVKYIAVSYVSSEGWLTNGLSRQLRNRIHHVGRSMGAEHVWIDELCLPPGDRTKYLETMGGIYRSAIAVCVISRDVINTGNPYALFSSTWMRRAWTFQEGYNAKKLVVLTSVVRDEYAIMTERNISPEYKYVALCRNSMRMSLSVSTALSRGITYPNDIPYVIASLMPGKGVKLLTGMTAYYVAYLAIYAAAMVIYAILKFVCMVGKCNLPKFPTYQLSLFIIVCACVLYLVLFCVSYEFSGLRWKDVNGLLGDSDAADTNILLLSPEPECATRKCWSPDITEQNLIDVVTCMNLTGSTPDDVDDLTWLCPSILVPLSRKKYVGKAALYIAGLLYYVLRGQGFRVRGKLLNKTETHQFIEVLRGLEWLWIQDAITVNTAHKNHRVLLVRSKDDHGLDWMMFGFVMLDRNNVLYRKHRFWILPVTHETASKCGQPSRNYWIGERYQGKF